MVEDFENIDTNFDGDNDVVYGRLALDGSLQGTVFHTLAAHDWNLNEGKDLLELAEQLKEASDEQIAIGAPQLYQLFTVTQKKMQHRVLLHPLYQFSFEAEGDIPAFCQKIIDWASNESQAAFEAIMKRPLDGDRVKRLRDAIAVLTEATEFFRPFKNEKLCEESALHDLAKVGASHALDLSERLRAGTGELFNLEINKYLKPAATFMNDAVAAVEQELRSQSEILTYDFLKRAEEMTRCYLDGTTRRVNTPGAHLDVDELRSRAIQVLTDYHRHFHAVGFVATLKKVGILKKYEAGRLRRKCEPTSPQWGHHEATEEVRANYRASHRLAKFDPNDPDVATEIEQMHDFFRKHSVLMRTHGHKYLLSWYRLSSYLDSVRDRHGIESACTYASCDMIDTDTIAVVPHGGDEFILLRQVSEHRVDAAVLPTSMLSQVKVGKIDIEALDYGSFYSFGEVLTFLSSGGGKTKLNEALGGKPLVIDEGACTIPLPGTYKPSQDAQEPAPSLCP
ncbi:hypothetical protein ACFOY8_12685 [Thalassospira xianhensis]|uniref:Uncharacterized protein n=1 Tax=Thalassospira xianhensis MCCC 1A02616 TaxID=1177929 RepID=A0A367UGW4_9PROT|nr:hypothetical protein [Thalassospira xianhensis]RCK06292.1 hypothetical protein TH5_08750 [Thalassospira xianhensis MCCC 1A02616]